MPALDFGPFWLTLRLAALSTVILFVVSVPLAFWLSRTRPLLRYPVQALVNLPLVLPPTVLGFYLLLLLSPERFPGGFLREHFGLSLAFSFPGLVIGSVAFSLPFMVNPILAGFENLPKSLVEESIILGATLRQTLFRILLPQVRPALVAGVVLSFMHTIGEFGVALMIGGKIPGKTLVASMAVYDEVESLNYTAAHVYAAILCAVSFVSLLLLLTWNKRPHGAI